VDDHTDIFNLTTVGGELCFFVRHVPPGADTAQSDIFCSARSADSRLLAKLPENVEPSWSVGVGDVLLFLALEPDQVRTPMLWRSAIDGSGAIRVPELTDVRGPLLAQDGAAYVARAAPSAALPALWRTDGTPAGSQALFVLPISAWQKAGTFGDGLWFQDFGGDVFVTDPGVSHIEQVLDPSGQFIGSVATPNALYSIFLNGGRSEVWRSDGFVGGSSLVASHPAPYPLVFGQVRESGGRTYYTAYDDELHWTLWVDDGSSNGRPLSATATPPMCSDHHIFGRICFQTGLFIVGSVNDRLLFQLDTTTWLTDGTVDGTVPLGDFSVVDGVEMNGTWFFARPRSGSESVYEFWATDGTLVGTVRVGDLPGQPSGFTPAGNRLFFLAARSLFTLEVPCGDPALERGAKALCDLRRLRRALTCVPGGPRVHLRKRQLHRMERLLQSALGGGRMEFLLLDQALARLSSRITHDARRLGAVCADGLLDRVSRLRARIAGLGA